MCLGVHNDGIEVAVTCKTQGVEQKVVLFIRLLDSVLGVGSRELYHKVNGITRDYAAVIVSIINGSVVLSENRGLAVCHQHHNGHSLLTILNITRFGYNLVGREKNLCGSMNTVLGICTGLPTGLSCITAAIGVSDTVGNRNAFFVVNPYEVNEIAVGIRCFVSVELHQTDGVALARIKHNCNAVVLVQCKKILDGVVRCFRKRLDTVVIGAFHRA